MRRFTRARKMSVSIQLGSLFLAACGGGGGGSPVPAPVPVATAPADAPAAAAPAAPAPTPAAPAPAPAAAPGSASVTVTGNIVAVGNTSYTVDAPSAALVSITLPPSASLQVGQTVTVSGASATEWQIAQNAGQSILTGNLPGGTPPGTNWAAAGIGPQVWHWLSSNVTGDVLVAGEAPLGLIRVSSDGGATWTAGNATPAVWISSDLTADGSRIVAVQYEGGMFTSTDRGVTWTRLTHPLVNVATGLAFESVTISRDGTRLAAVVQNGSLLVSTDAGATWAAATLPGTVQTRPWRSVDSSADGQFIVAASEDGDVFLSSDAGATFTALPVLTGTPAARVFENWYRVKMSADGQVIAIAGNAFGGTPGTGIYVSRDRGATWTKGLDRVGDYTALAMSDDGSTIAATISNTGTTPGQVFRSVDGGVSFQALTLPAGETNWRAIAMSFDANRLVVAAGSFVTRTAGPMDISTGSRTTPGVAGGIGGGGAGEVLQLRYLGNDTFRVVQATGTFAPR